MKRLITALVFAALVLAGCAGLSGPAAGGGDAAEGVVTVFKAPT